MTKQTILTGIRANNDLHIGNYFGALLPIIDMAKTKSQEYQINMFIPDLHSFTTPIDHSVLYEQILNNARLFVAAGLPLDNDSIHLYRQSYVPAHSELTWILDCFTGFGEMSRMTQFKDKSKDNTKEQIEDNSRKSKSISTSSKDDADLLDELIKTYANKFKSEEIITAIYNIGIQAKKDLIKATKDHTETLKRFNKYLEESINAQQSSVGLFNYPVLMAADILLYNANYIPVGDDQTQHLEFTRDIAERMNNRFGDIFTIPEPVAKQHEFFGKDQGLRIKDLVNPAKKMSKSDESGKGVIFLGDDPDAAAKKIMSATTDDKAKIHYDRTGQPGISNLIDILALLRSASPNVVAEEFEGQTRYGDFKKVVADEMRQFLVDFQTRLAAVDDAAVLAKLQKSETEMNQIANATLLRAQKAVGLRAKDA